MVIACPSAGTVTCLKLAILKPSNWKRESPAPVKIYGSVRCRASPPPYLKSGPPIKSPNQVQRRGFMAFGVAWIEMRLRGRTGIAGYYVRVLR